LFFFSHRYSAHRHLPSFPTRRSSDLALTDPVWASAAHGAVRLEVSAGSRFVLDATAEPGEVQVDVPGLVLTSTSAGLTKGEIGGGGSSVHLQARHGDVRVQAATTAAAKNP